MKHTEEWVQQAVEWARLLVEAMGAFTVALGATLAFGLFLRALFRRGAIDFNAIRLTMARYLALALEFQLASDILSTAVAPSWDQIGKLAAVAVIRTVLDSFLSREIKEESEMEKADAIALRVDS